MTANPAAPNPIDGVVEELERLVAWAQTGPQAPSRIGFFASLYLRVTTTIKSRLGTGFFDDDARMESLDAAFAERYLTAVKQYLAKDPALGAGWSIALDATTRSDLIVVQHLLLAMNPHINFDLALAAVATCPGPLLAPLHDDFIKITDVLAGIVPTVVSEIGSCSPMVGMLNFLDESGEIQVLNFSMSEARTAAWTWATQLNGLAPAQQPAEIARVHALVAHLSGLILSPGAVLQIGVDLVRSFESKDVAGIIRTLDNGNQVHLLPALPS
jgi:hypothetical protein